MIGLRRDAVLLVGALVLAGCAGPGAQLLPAAPPPLAPACAAGALTPTDGVCAYPFDAEGGWDGEADLATHPSDAQKALVTWTRKGPDWRIWVATTADGGATWAQQELAPPQGAVAEQEYDSTAAYGPDGTAYVLYGVARCPAGACFTSPRMTLARSEDDGATWSYHDVGDELVGWPGYDYMDVAVAPDTGALYVASSYWVLPLATTRPDCMPQVPRPRLSEEAQEWIVVFRSTDRGETWECANVLDQWPAPPYVFPRVAAGPGGVVAVGAHLEPYPTGGAGIAISVNGGRTFSPFHHVTPLAGGNVDPAVWTHPSGTTVVDLVVHAVDRVRVFRSTDLGVTWTPHDVATYPPGLRDGAWLAARGAPDGTIAILDKYGHHEEPVRMIARVTVWREETGAQSYLLVNSTAEHGAWVRGDDYGGVSIGPDGAVWAAWSDPREGGHENARVLVARLGPTA